MSDLASVGGSAAPVYSLPPEMVEKLRDHLQKQLDYYTKIISKETGKTWRVYVNNALKPIFYLPPPSMEPGIANPGDHQETASDAAAVSGHADPFEGTLDRSVADTAGHTFE